MIFFRSKLTKVIAHELASGGRYESLVSPLPSLNHFNFIQFRSHVNGIGDVFGLYADPDFKRAQIVSFFEFLDRKAFFENSARLNLLTTSGIASHKFRFLAAQSGRSELIERDSVLAHWYSRTPMIEVPIANALAPIADDLANLGYKLYLRKTFLGVEDTYVALIVNRTSNGFVLGSSSGKGAVGSVTKATLEAVINLFFGNYGNTTETLLSRLEKDGISNLESHRTYWLYRNQIPSWFLDAAPQERREIRKFKPSFETVDLTRDPYPVVAVRSSDLLQLKVGSLKSIDLAILTKRMGPSYKPVVDENPHPIF